MDKLLYDLYLFGQHFDYIQLITFGMEIFDFRKFILSTCSLQNIELKLYFLDVFCILFPRK